MNTFFHRLKPVLPVAQTLDVAEKLFEWTAPYGRGSVCCCKRLVPILSRDHRERFSAFFSNVFKSVHKQG